MTDDERYAAIRTRDSRFDGAFFTCVRSTGIFCRPSCPARTPSRSQVEFVLSAAAAVTAGYRACKRCGPSAPPGSPDEDPSGSLAGRALLLIEAGALDDGGTVPGLARRLCVSERTLHRALVDRTGAGALAHARLRRARRAHELVTGSTASLSLIAHAAGFGSERQFRDTFLEVFGHAPSVVRQRSRRDPGTLGLIEDGARVRVDLSVRRPFDGDGLGTWCARRAVPGVESVEGSVWTRALRLPHGPGVVRIDLAAAGPLQGTLLLSDLRDHGMAVATVRHLLDLDADPVGIDGALAASMPALAPLIAARPGVRLPGTSSLAEALLWAITGQQITLDQTREQITRATDLLTEPLPEALRTGTVDRLPVDPARAAQRATEWFRGPMRRREALQAALRVLSPKAPGTVSGDISAHAPALDTTRPVPELRAALLDLPGVGPWTADYVLLRAARAPDAAPVRDAALLSAARDLGIAEDHRALEMSLRAAAPWRSYAAMHLWHHTPDRSEESR